MYVGLIIVGVLFAAFFFWSIGRIAIMRGLVQDANARSEDASEKLARVEIERDALQQHCDELRLALGQANARPTFHVVNMSDEQVGRIAQAILSINIPQPKFVQ